MLVTMVNHRASHDDTMLAVEVAVIYNGVVEYIIY